MADGALISPLRNQEMLSAHRKPACLSSGPIGAPISGGAPAWISGHIPQISSDVPRHGLTLGRPPPTPLPGPT